MNMAMQLLSSLGAYSIDQISICNCPSAGGGKGACRFCGTNSNTVLHPIGYVCSDAECIGRSEEVCDKTFPCGHACNGVKGEEECLPCLYGCESSKLKQDADDMCMICYTEGLSCAPCVQVRRLWIYN